MAKIIQNVPASIPQVCHEILIINDANYNYTLQQETILYILCNTYSINYYQIFFIFSRTWQARHQSASNTNRNGV